MRHFLSDQFIGRTDVNLPREINQKIWEEDRVRVSAVLVGSIQVLVRFLF